MLTFHELIGFMSPGMANRILDDTQANNREVYRALVASMAQAQKMRPVFIGRQPKERRHKNFVQMLTRTHASGHINVKRGRTRRNDHRWQNRRQLPIL